jgi:peptidoglycan/LPS O-acetylase OafA/YrhL
LGTTAIAVWFLAPQALQERFFRDVSAATIYVANWVFAFDSVDYLAADNSASVVQHFWSLGVEEQLYIAWPILLSLTWLIGRRKGTGFKLFALVLVLITIASLVYSSILVFDQNPIAYFSTLSRAWEFGAGALLALATRTSSSESKTGFSLQHVMSWVGWITLAAYLYFFEASSGFPGLFAVVPVIATLLIIAANDPRGKFSPARILHLRPIQFIGDASYSIYLWHWPILTFVGFYFTRIPGRVLVIVFIATLVVSALSMKFVENPFRFGQLRQKLKPNQTFIAVATSMALLLSGSQVASAFVANEIEQKRLASAALEAEIAKSVAEKEAKDATESSMPVWDAISCMGPAFMVQPECAGFEWESVVPAVAVKEETAHNVEPLERIGSTKGCLAWGDDYSMIECVYGVKGGTKIAMVGDSHAYHWLPAMASVAASSNIQLHFLARAGCPANSLPREANGNHVRGCFAWMAEMQAWVESNPDVETIVVSNFSGSRFSGAGEYGARHDGAIQGYKDVWQPWIEQGIRVVVFQDTPFIGEDAWNCVVNNVDEINRCDVTLASIQANFDNTVAAAKELDLEVIDFTKYFCKDEMCPMAIGGVRVYRDSNHMSGTYNLLMAPYLKDELLELLD